MGINFTNRPIIHLQINNLYYVGNCRPSGFFRNIPQIKYERTDYKKLRKERYASFDSGSGKEFEDGKLSLEDLRDYAI